MICSPQQLSIILTTSPIKSNPSTYILDSSIDCILNQPSLSSIHIYIICDGAKISPHDENKYKSGIISQESYDNYLIFKDIIREKYGQRKQKFTIIEREFRCGFAENIKFVMEEYAKTDHVMIYQHDYIIEKELPFGEVVEMMRQRPKEFNYITFMNPSYLSLVAKYQSVAKIRNFFLKLLNKPETYNFMANIKEFTKEIAQFFRTKYGMPLMPLNFWYDKLHIASRKYYLDVIFNEKGNFDPNRGKNMKTVTFVEDTFGHCMKWTIDEEPQAMINTFCAYILWEEKPVFYHSSGRTFITEETRQGLRINVEKNEDSFDSDIDLAEFEQMASIQDNVQEPSTSSNSNNLQQTQ